MQNNVYLDNNATTPLDPRVLEAMLPYYTENFGNAASSQHAYGWVADEAVKVARGHLAQLLRCGPEELFFTSGATESINLALKGAFENYGKQKKHIITLATEHPAVLDTCTYLSQIGAEVSILPVKDDGLVDLDLLRETLREDTLLVTVMFANNETGVIQPIKEIAEIAHSKSALFFCDATQALGKVDVNVQELGIDILASSAHKMYGPKGCGLLYIRRKNPRVKLSPQMQGGGHEEGMRSGTLNVPAIAGFGKAGEISFQEMEKEAERLTELRDLLEQALLDRIEGSTVNGNTKHRMPHVSNVILPQVNAASLMSRLLHVAISAGSACSSAHPEPSHVLKAMGLSLTDSKSSLRFSLGRFNTLEEIEYAIGEIEAVAGQLKKELNPS